VEIEFNGYRIDISSGGVVVYGCDCAADMDDHTVLRVYHALGNYLIQKGQPTNNTEETITEEPNVEQSEIPVTGDSTPEGWEPTNA
jgi:hypothetical protein